jgi:hypothetical protein
MLHTENWLWSSWSWCLWGIKHNHGESTTLYALCHMLWGLYCICSMLSVIHTLLYMQYAINYTYSTVYAVCCQLHILYCICSMLSIIHTLLYMQYATNYGLLTFCASLHSATLTTSMPCHNALVFINQFHAIQYANPPTAKRHWVHSAHTASLYTDSITGARHKMSHIYR